MVCKSLGAGRTLFARWTYLLLTSNGTSDPWYQYVRRMVRLWLARYRHQPEQSKETWENPTVMSGPSWHIKQEIGRASCRERV